MDHRMVFQEPDQPQAHKGRRLCDGDRGPATTPAPGMDDQVLAFGLQANPRELNHVLQETLDAATLLADAILLDYGLCAKAVIGLRAADCTLAVPKAVLDDTNPENLHAMIETGKKYGVYRI